jgi:hypothetical protein
VEFRLLYEGELLPSAGTKKRTPEKHAIRRTFHPQLRRLWEISPNLKQLADISWIHTLSDDQADELNDNRDNPKYSPNPGERTSLGLKSIGQKWSRAGYNFVPLVTEDMALRCSIDITLLRPEEKKLIFEAGDIDGQLKTLFDALRMPKNADETSGIAPNEDEDPFFCLLEDDRLVTEVRVNTDTMLLLPNTREVRANDAHAIIHVSLNHKTHRTFNNYFG